MPMRRGLRLEGMAAAVFLAAACGAAQADSAAATSSTALHDGQHDFDFLIGSWKIHLKKLLRPLSTRIEDASAKSR